ncbi:MAG: hypothetical protein A2Y25_08580 [Candidatus Melainabacteria bacterium GWF2_37_15]|nr:MAG: hypothetical protein A2Y25_08580 [Candidatus Melainabacteria bacterium GWF2_37_15]
MKMSAPLKVGILALLSTCILIFGIMWLKGRSISIGEKIEVKFKDVDGMRPGSGVQMMGLRIGQVDEIVPVINGENSYIVVRFVINEPGVTIPTASRISIQQSGIIGEKFVEITPPFPVTVYLPVTQSFTCPVKQNTPVEVLVEGKFANIGKVKEAKIVDTVTLPSHERLYIRAKKAHKISYVITVPGIEIPLNSAKKLAKASKNGEYVLRVTPPENILVKLPEVGLKYTVVEPLRMKEFLDVQLQAALALKETNDKINGLFTDQFMDDVRYTFENTKELSEKAALIVDQVAVIIDSSKEDLRQLIASSTELSENMTELAANLNNIVGDSEFKDNLITTTQTIRTTSEEFSHLLKNSKLEESFININSTTKDMSEIVQYINTLTKDEEFNDKVEETVVNLNDLMIKLSKVTDSLQELTVEEKATIKQIISNSNDASEDLKKFSKKLNKRFLLLRLLI